MQPKNTYTRTVHGTENRQWVCVNDLEKSLRTTRINVRGKESVKLNVNGKPRRFMHKKHLELILGRKPSSNMVASWLRRVFLKSHTMKVEAEIRTMTKQITEKRNQLLKEEAKFILSDNAAGMREFVIRAFDLQEYEDGINLEELRLREIDRKRESGEDQKIEELPATLEPHKWSKDKIQFRWIEHEDVTWLEVETFCSAMKYGTMYCTMDYKPRDFEGVYLAEHQGDTYVNAKVLRWHTMRVPQYETGRVAVLEHFIT